MIFMKTLNRKSLLLLTLFLLYFVRGTMAQTVPWGSWTSWGDQGDGTYRNPVIPADFSDIDCIRVGNDYYAISSTFQFSPGMTILHSKDLVNWEICGNAVNDLTQISESLDWTRMNRYGRGVWAGTLRYHNRRFYIFFGTPDEGYFMTSAAHPEGPWEPLVSLLPEAGWDDCTVLWDDEDNGKAYFLGTHFADGYRTYLFHMAADGRSIDRQSAVLANEGNGREASKLIKVGRWYYLVFSEHRNGVGRYVMAKRALSAAGPYTEERQLALPSVDAMEPNQGGIVEGKDGYWYFLTHHGTGDWSGRVVSLLPVTWVDEWPIIGNITDTGIGQMVWTGHLPYSLKGKKLRINRSDDFDGIELAPQWQWNYQPRHDFFSLKERRGWLRLKAFRPLERNVLLKAGNTLTQRTFRQQHNVVVVKIDISHMENGQKAGLCHFSSSSSAIGVVKDGDSCYLEFRINDHPKRGLQISSRHIWLRSEWGLNGLSHYSYSIDGEHFHSFGQPYQMIWGNYRGDRIGLYCFNDDKESGFVDVDYFYYD